jgi:hypothetical protein
MLMTVNEVVHSEARCLVMSTVERPHQVATLQHAYLRVRPGLRPKDLAARWQPGQPGAERGVEVGVPMEAGHDGLCYGQMLQYRQTSAAGSMERDWQKISVGRCGIVGYRSQQPLPLLLAA